MWGVTIEKTASSLPPGFGFALMRLPGMNKGGKEAYFEQF
jgi:hypothetical protein